MRLVGALLSLVLGVAVVVEGVSLMKTRRQVAELQQRLETLTAQGPSFAGTPTMGSSEVDQGGGDEGGVRPSGLGRRSAGPPRFLPGTEPPAASAPTVASANGASLAMPPVLDSPAAREQLKQFVRAQMEAEREERRKAAEQEREQRVQAGRERMARDLGLSPAEADRFSQILVAQQNARRDLGAQVESGTLSREQVGAAYAAARQQGEQDMKALLGDERMAKFQEMNRRGGGRGGPPGGPAGESGGGGDRGGPTGGDRGGRGRWGGGPPGGAVGGGQAGTAGGALGAQPGREQTAAPGTSGSTAR